MPRKSNPQALAIVGSGNREGSSAGPGGRIDDHQNSLTSPGSELNKHIIRSNNNTLTLNSPLSPISPTTPKSPRSPFKFSLKPASNNHNHSARPPMQVPDAVQHQDDIELPTSPTSPFQIDITPNNNHNNPTTTTASSTEVSGGSSQEGPKRHHGKGGFFSNYKASKSSSKVNKATPQLLPDESMPVRENNNLEMISKVSSAAEAKNHNHGSELKKTVTRKPIGGNAKSSDVSLALSTDSTASDSYAHSNMAASTQTATSTAQQGKKNKGKPFGILGRSRSTRDKDKNKDRGNNANETQSPRQQSPSERSQNGRVTPAEQSELRQPPPSVHLQNERDQSLENKSLKDSMGGSSQRQNSKDRKPTAVKENNNMARDKEQHNKSQQSVSSTGGGNGHSFLSGLNSFGTKAADKISKSIFNKGGRSGSTNEKDGVVDDDHYVIKVLNRPLLEQTRKTRISKRLEDSRDKTEFWMPALPWRCIDYLNYKGCEVEGLYRVPGSGPQIKMWQRKFDEGGDLDLFEQEELYDINIIGSMLKSWFRELPDEIFPKSSQDRVARECAALGITADDVESVDVPQVLIDELSNLSPFNYYLLFAITCHLSLLLNHSEKNKMDFRNLCICFQPCMKIDALCFKFLVCDWRSCWQGCKTEGAYVEQEYQLFDMVPPVGTIQGEPPVTYEGRSSVAVESVDERNVSSSGSSKPSSVSAVADSTNNSKPRNGASKQGHGQGQGQTQGQGQGHQATNSQGNGGKLKPSQAPNVSLNTQSQTMSSNYNQQSTGLVADRAVTPRGSQDNGNMRPLSPIKPLSPMGF